MSKTIYETNYDRAVKLGLIVDGGLPESHRVSKSDGFMDLVYERLEHLDGFNNQNTQAFSITHYFEQNGDLCKDPDMVVFFHSELKMLEAFSFQMDMPPLYQVVYPEPRKVYPKVKNELNSFLRQWLTNLINQGHGKAWIDSDEAA